MGGGGGGSEGTDAQADTIRALRARSAAGEAVVPTIYGSGGHLTVPGSHPIATVFPPSVRRLADSIVLATPDSLPADPHPLGIGLSLVESEAAAVRAVRDRADDGMDLIKITVESGPTPFGDHHPQMSLAVVHTVRNDPLPDAALAARMAADGFGVIPTLVLFTPPDLDDPFLRETVTDAELEALRAPDFRARFGRFACCAPFEQVSASVGAMHRAGVAIAVGTDTGNPFVFPGYGVHREMELLVGSGLTTAEALSAGTLEAARMIGRDGDTGSIEVGKRADLLLLERSPLDDIRHTRGITTVIAGGRVIDRERLRAEER